MMGGPLPHVVAAKAVALREAQGRDFKEYSRRTVENARALADACMAAGLDVVTGGTDNHLLLVNVAFDRVDWPTGGKRASLVRDNAQSQFPAFRSERPLVYERLAPRNACRNYSWHGTR